MGSSIIHHQSLLQLLLARRTVHQFKPEPVDREIIQQALISSVYVPNHKHTNPVRYKRVGKSARQKLTARALELKRAKQNNIELTPTIEEAIRSQYLYPDTLLAVTQIKSESPMQQKEDYATLACALHNISLVLWGHGVGTKWSSGEIIRDKMTYEILGVDSTKESIEAFFWIGIPMQVPAAPAKPNVNDILREVE
jgi:nitroreductase